MKLPSIPACVQWLFIVAMILSANSCLDTPRHYTYTVVRSYPHDNGAFTQGFVFHEGVFYEGTGRYGQSSLRKVAVDTGEVLQKRDLDSRLFGEGITVLEDRIIQLTWKSRMGFVYDRASFEPRGEFQYPTEGWGLTTNGEHLIMSDGSSTLYYLDPDTFEQVGAIDVKDGNATVTRLNELEYINGRIYANIWQTDRIAVIFPADGRVAGWIDLSGLLDRENLAAPADVLNGIAYDAGSDRLFVTGKLWPLVFEIKLIPK